MMDETPPSGVDGAKRSKEESPDPSPKRSMVSLLDPLEDIIDNSGFLPTRADRDEVDHLELREIYKDSD